MNEQKNVFNNLLTAFSTCFPGQNLRFLKVYPLFPHLYQQFYVENYVENVQNSPIQRIQNFMIKFCKNDELGRFFSPFF